MYLHFTQETYDSVGLLTVESIDTFLSGKHHYET